MPPIDATYTAPSELLERQYGSGPKQLGGQPMSILVAAGPYTLDSDLEYEPLEALVGLAMQEKPDVLILVRGKAPLLILCRDLMLTCCRLRPTDRPVRRCLAPAPRPRRSRRAPGVSLPDSRLQQARLAHPDEPADASPPHPERTRPREPARGVPASAVRERCRAGLAEGETPCLPARNGGKRGTDPMGANSPLDLPAANSTPP